MYKVENYRGRNEEIRRKIRDVNGHNRRKQITRLEKIVERMTRQGGS